jgi:hypothetical protein
VAGEEALHVAERLRGGAVARLALARREPGDQARRPLRGLRRPLANVGEVQVHVAGEDRQRGAGPVLVEGEEPRQAAPQHEAERVQVGADVEVLLAEGLLGGHVERCPQDEARLRQGRPLVERAPGEPQVGELRRPRAIEEDVLRLHVAMDEAAPLGVRQRLEQRVGEPQDLILRQAPPAAGQELLERAALDELERDVVAARGAVVPLVDHRHDVRVVQQRGGLRLAQEAQDELAVDRQVGGEDLERHGAVEAHLPGEVDLAHGARAERALDHEARDAEPGGAGA